VALGWGVLPVPKGGEVGEASSSSAAVGCRSAGGLGVLARLVRLGGAWASAQRESKDSISGTSHEYRQPMLTHVQTRVPLQRPVAQAPVAQLAERVAQPEQSPAEQA
jgi:hypothetical protein